MSKSKWYKVGALWTGRTKGVLTGRPDGLMEALLPKGARLVVQKVNEKKYDNGPDFEIMVVVDEEEPKQAPRNTPNDDNDPPF